MINLKHPLILASGSKARQEMLRGVGLDFTVQPADIDEEIVQQSGKTPVAIAAQLAREKAMAVSAQNPSTLVIGSDQVLEFDGYILNKSKSIEGAVDKLKKLRGQHHQLISAVAVALGGEVLWEHCDSADLLMHDVDDRFLQTYALRAGEALTSAVGGYWLEAEGAWLFDEIKGNYFTILGMPLLPLLTYLREEHTT